MNTDVTFKSERFRPILPEECQVNPGRYGAELAYWFCTELMSAGITTSYPNYEDWGWFIEYANEDGDEFWLCCSNIDGTDDEWMCFLDAKGSGFFGTNKPPMEKAIKLQEAVAKLLKSEPSVQDVNWARNTA